MQKIHYCLLSVCKKEEIFLWLYVQNGTLKSYYSQNSTYEHIYIETQYELQYKEYYVLTIGFSLHRRL